MVFVGYSEKDIQDIRKSLLSFKEIRQIVQKKLDFAKLTEIRAEIP